MPNLTLPSRAHADDADEALKLARQALGALDYAALLFDQAARLHDGFAGASAIVRDAAADIEPAERELTRAVLEEDASRAYGEPVRYAVTAHRGSI